MAAVSRARSAVYTHSSTLGFEAIFAGHKPRVFGQPFYAGWGLTDDQNAPPRRERVLTRAQLFAAAMILYPVWYDPAHRPTLSNSKTSSRIWRLVRVPGVKTGRATPPWA